MTVPGSLQVIVNATTKFAYDALPFTVRDAHLRILHTGRVGDNSIPLAGGLYSVDLVTHTGATASTVVSIGPDAAVRVEISSAGDLSVIGDNLSRTQEITRPRLAVDHHVGWIPTGLKLLHSSMPRAVPPPTFSLESSAGCETNALLADVSGVEMAPTIYVADPDPTQVPTAVFHLGARRIEMSLPVNPYGHTAEQRKCIVARVNEHGKSKLRMSFPPEREASVMVDGLLRGGSAARAGGLLQRATSLLFEKYSDPVGAALGGLALHRLGQLRQRQSWVGNLARDFPWLPDGQILYAALAMNSELPDERADGLRLLLKATEHRPLFTDGLALAIEMLRNWPGNDSRIARRDRFAHLNEMWARADWDSINLSTEPDEPAPVGATFLIAPGASIDWNDPTVRNGLAHAEILRNLDPNAIATLRRYLQPVQFAPGQTVFAEGDFGDRCYVVVDGRIKVGRRSMDGHGALLRIVGPSDTLGEVALFDPAPRTATAVATTDVTAVELDRTAFRSWLAERPDLSDQVMRGLARRLRTTSNELADAHSADVPGRVAKQLQDLSERFGVAERGATRIADYIVTRDEIAELTGASREAVNTALRRFAVRGWITVRHNEILIHDAQPLRDRARGEIG